MNVTSLHRPADVSGHASLVAGNTAFALDLYARLGAEPGNLFFSPYSISTALAMTYAGARGATAREMAGVLHFGDDTQQLYEAFAELQARFEAVAQQGEITLRVANALWPQAGYSFLPVFLECLQRDYGSSITPVDYARDPDGSRQKINRWVEDMTRDKIKDLLQPEHVDSFTMLVLVNAIYFKGNWARRFDAAETHDAPFRLAGGEAVEVPMMAQKGKFGYADRAGLQVLELPYRGEDLSFVILLPSPTDELAGLERTLTADNLRRWVARLYPTDVEITLPRFKLTGKFGLADTLRAMGMATAFGNADFSGMTGGRGFFLSDVIHKAFVGVNEAGSEAAAATAVLVSRGLPEKLAVFRADRPFIFMIRDTRTGSILFLGRVADPR